MLSYDRGCPCLWGRKQDLAGNSLDERRRPLLPHKRDDPGLTTH